MGHSKKYTENDEDDDLASDDENNFWMQMILQRAEVS